MQRFNPAVPQYTEAQCILSYDKSPRILPDVAYRSCVSDVQRAAIPIENISIWD